MSASEKKTDWAKVAKRVLAREDHEVCCCLVDHWGRRREREMLHQSGHDQTTGWLDFVGKDLLIEVIAQLMGPALARTPRQGKETDAELMRRMLWAGLDPEPVQPAPAPSPVPAVRDEIGTHSVMAFSRLARGYGS